MRTSRCWPPMSYLRPTDGSTPSARGGGDRRKYGRETARELEAWGRQIGRERKKNKRAWAI
eukprot:1978630-Rhodomonas_salina.4